MAEVASKHAFTSAKSDSADATLVQPSNWNADHVYSGGTKGDILLRDTAATNGASWLASVSTGQVLVSGGAGSLPAFSASPSLTTLTLATSLTIDGNTLNGTEFAALDGITAGTVTASKAVIVDADKDISSFRTLTAVNLKASGLTSGRVPVAGTGGLLQDSAAFTFDGTTLTSPAYALSGTISSAAWTTNGIRLRGVAATLTDTSSSGTVAAAYTDKLGGNTIAAATSTTFTDYATLDIEPPVVGTNVAITNPYALRLGGGLKQVGGVTSFAPASVTGSATTSGLTLAQTWNTTGVVDGAVRIAITDTASGASSLPFAIYGGASATTSLFKVDKAGNATALGEMIAAGMYPGAYAILSGTGRLTWNGRGSVYATADGVYLFSNTAATDVGRIQFGGTTSSYPALAKRAANGLEILSAAGTSTFNDASTAASGTLADRGLFSISMDAAPTLTATNSSVTYTNASTLYIPGAPVASTNVTITNAYALKVAAGNSYFGGTINTANNIIGEAASTSLYVSKGLHVGGTSDAGDNNLLVDGNSTLTGGVLVGSATGGMPSAGVINATGLKINGVDVGTSSSSYWNASGTDIYYSAGKVGIGTTNPGSLFEVSGTNSSAEVRITRSNNVGVGSELGTLIFRAPNDGGTTKSWAQIRTVVTGPTNPNEAADLCFNTLNGASFGERLRITSAGNVGIGTTSPSTALHVAAASVTGSATTGGITFAQTWNTSGAPTAILANITDTASNAASLLMNLQVGSVSQFKVSKAGAGTFSGDISRQGANGQKSTVSQTTVLSGAMSGATLTLSNLIPAGSLVLGITVHPTTAITSGDGATTYTVGDGSTADKFATGIAFASDINLTNTNLSSPAYYKAATNVVLTATGGTFNAGVVRVTVHFITLTSPSS